MNQAVGLGTHLTRMIARAAWPAAAAFPLVFAALWAWPVFGSLALWPVDAILAGALLRSRMRVPSLAWPLLGAALVLARLAWGQAAAPAAAQGLADLSGLFVVWLVLSRFLPQDSLRTPGAIVRILLAGLAGAIVLSAVARGLGYLQTGGIPGSADALSGLLGRWLGYCVFLPPVLLLPRPGFLRGERRRAGRGLLRLLAARAVWLPPLAWLASLALCLALGGAGSLVFPLASLMYCAHACSQRMVAWLVLLTVLGIVSGIGAGWPGPPAGGSLTGMSGWALVSLQLGLLLVVAAPLLMSSALAARSDLIVSLNRALDHDEMTQALSRPAFMRGAQEYLRQIPPFLHGNGLMMLDIDHFKQLNDTHGHAAGDNVLQEFSRTIRGAIRPQDLFGRLGGEEFGLILPGCSLEDAVETARRLRACVEGISLYYDSDEPLRITVSIGIVHDTQSPRADLDELLRHADQALYRAKRGGRNRVCLYGTSERDCLACAAEA